MGFFANRKRDKEDQKWLEGADFTECLELLFEGTPDEDMKRRLFLLQCSKKNEGRSGITKLGLGNVAALP